MFVAQQVLGNENTDNFNFDEFVVEIELKALTIHPTVNPAALSRLLAGVVQVEWLVWSPGISKIKPTSMWLGCQNNSWLVVSKIFYFHPYLGKIPILTNIFQMG